MKKTILTCILSVLAVGAQSYAMAGQPANGPVETSSLLQKATQPIYAEIEPNYNPPLDTTLYKSEIHIDEEDIITRSGRANRAENESRLESARILTTAAQPPVYSIDLDGTYSDSLTSTVPEKWYVFNVSAATKFTTLLQHQAQTNGNIDIELYRQPTGASSFSFVAGSYMSGLSNEQLSEMAVPGSYLLIVQAVDPALGGSYAFGNLSSSGADANEPDDNFWQAQLQAVNEGVNGNLDSGIDKDFHRIELATAESINYRITGGDYHAQLFYANGQLAFTLPNNTVARINLPAGTYYWGIESPSSVASPAVPYTFSAYRDVDSMTFNFGSDEGINGRVNWGAGNYFAFKDTATISGYAYDVDGNPVAGAAIRLTLTGSVGLSQTVASATTNAQGYYSTTISSPTGAGSNAFTGACNIYYYDVHKLDVESDFGTVTESINTITLIDGGNEVDVLNSQVLLNDVAYYIYIGC